MRRLAGVVATGVLFVGGNACGESEPEISRNPLAINVAIENELDRQNFSDELIAGLGLGLAEECVVYGFADTSDIEDVPDGLQTGDFYKGYGMVLNGSFSRSAVVEVCEAAIEQINSSV